MKRAGGGRREAIGGSQVARGQTREAAKGKREARPAKSRGAAARPFAEVMRTQGMAAPAALAQSIEAAVAQSIDASLAQSIDAPLGGGAAPRAPERKSGGKRVGRNRASGTRAPIPHPNNDSEVYLRAAERLLDRVLGSQCESRAAALDLLTVDALMTRAMEIAAHDPTALAELPELAMKRIAAK